MNIDCHRAPGAICHKITCVIALLFSVWVSVAAQSGQPRLDSLASVARTHQGDTLGVLTYADLCYEYRFVNQDSALKFGRKGIALGRLLGFKNGTAQAYSDAAFIHYDRGDLDSAVAYWESALALRTEKPKIASLQMKLGATYFRKGTYDEALRYQLAALRIYEELELALGIGQALNNVAAVYQHQNDLDNALKYYEKSYALHQSNGHRAEMGLAQINIGNVYFLSKDYETAKQNYLKALILLPGDKQLSDRGIAMNNLAEIYTAGERYDSAAYYSERALTLRRAVGDAGGVISSLNMTGRIHARLKNFAVGEKYLREALALASEKNILYEQGRIYENLYELYRDKGDWRKSLDAHVRFATIRDSLLNETGRKEVAALQVQYETEKKEQQISLQTAELLQKEVRIERDAIIIISMAVAIALSFVIFILLRNRQKRKAEMQRKENEIALRDAYIRATIESQEDERKRFARDLHDGMGQWISSLHLILSEIQQPGDDAHKLEVLSRADRIMGDINDEFRSIAFNLMPHTLIHYGLKDALTEMAQRLNTVNKCTFSVTAFEFPERLSELTEISIYRIVQEWANNILKYSDASRVEIQLTGHERELIVMVEDNGRGFDVQSLRTGAGNGWKNILSRSNLVKGAVDIDSSPGRAGTTLTLTVPIGSAARPAEQAHQPAKLAS